MKKVFGLIYLSLIFLQNAQAQTKYEMKSFDVVIKGSSTMHDWESKVTTVNMSGEFILENNVLKNIHSATVEMVTKSIKSKKESSMMDSRTYSTLKADQYPKIKFVFTKVQSIKATGSEVAVTVLGNLTLAGSTQSTELVMKAKMLSGGIIEFIGSKKLKMSSYGVKPPSFMMGALKVADDVTIDFTINLKKSSQQ